MDRIELRGLRCPGHHGVLESERRQGQTFMVDVTLERDLSRPGETDDLADTVDYGALARQLHQAVESTRFDLIEALAAHLAGVALAAGDVQAVEVRVAKPDAPMPVDCDEVAVRVRREQPRAEASP